MRLKPFWARPTREVGDMETKNALGYKRRSQGLGKHNNRSGGRVSSFLISVRLRCILLPYKKANEVAAYGNEPRRFSFLFFSTLVATRKNHSAIRAAPQRLSRVYDEASWPEDEDQCGRTDSIERHPPARPKIVNSDLSSNSLMSRCRGPKIPSLFILETNVDP